VLDDIEGSGFHEGQAEERLPAKPGLFRVLGDVADALHDGLDFSAVGGGHEREGVGYRPGVIRGQVRSDELGEAGEVAQPGVGLVAAGVGVHGGQGTGTGARISRFPVWILRGQ
jgi:hypothetical protein